MAHSFQELVGGIDPSIQTAVRQYLDLPDVCIVTKLECRTTGQTVTVGNVHINWGKMETPDIQCVQVGYQDWSEPS